MLVYTSRYIKLSILHTAHPLCQNTAQSVLSKGKVGGLFASPFPALISRQVKGGVIMIITYEYQIEYDKIANGYRVRSKHAALCPRCNQLLSGYDTRRRKVIGDDGETVYFLLRRLRCPSCGKLHLEIPDLIAPHKHYSAEVIRQAIRETKGFCPADDSTIRRWKRPK